MSDDAQDQTPAAPSGLLAGHGAPDNGTPFGAPPAPPAAPEQPAAPPASAPLAIGELDKPVVTPDTNRADAYAYEPTGNASLDYALDFVGQLGYGPAHPAILAAQDGNFHLLQAELAREGVRGADAVIALAKEAYTQETAKYEAAQQETAKYAHESAGGEANWNQVQQWASANATPAEKAQINELLAAGGFAAQSAITFLIQQYSKVQTLSRPAAKVATGTAAGGRARDVGGALTAHEYGQKVQELMLANGGRDVSSTAEYAALQQRRLQGRRSGI